MQGSKLYVGNLNFDAREDQLKELFAPFGEIKDLTIIKDKFSGRSKGFGFVEFSSPKDAEKAAGDLNEQEFLGRQLRIAEAKPKRNDRG